MGLALKDLISKIFLLFATKALRELEGIRLSSDRYLKYLAHEFEQFAAGHPPRMVVNIPPGHLKTSLGSVCLSAWLLAHEPSLKIIIVTHAEHLSKSIARKIRGILLATWFKNIFATRIKKGHAEVTDFGTTTGGGVFVTSFGASFTGRRADVIIVDDPHDISDEIEQIEATVESFSTVLLSRLNDRKNGRVLVIAHRVHERDLSAHLLQRKKWKPVVLPLIAIKDHRYEFPDGRWFRRTGELLRADTYDPEDIDELRASLVNPDFELLYQQDAASQALPAITADHFPLYLETEPSRGPIVLSVDPGVADRKRSAFSVIQAWCVTPTQYLLLDQFREQIDFAGLREAVRRYRKIFRPVALLIERSANGHAIISEFGRKYPQLVRPVDLDGRSKSARFRTHVDTIISKRISLPARAPWRDDFVREFSEFPKGRFTDQVDAATQFLDHAPEFAGMAPSPVGGIAASDQGRMVTAQPSRGDARGFVAVRNGRPIELRQSAGPVFSIKTEVQY